MFFEWLLLSWAGVGVLGALGAACVALSWPRPLRTAPGAQEALQTPVPSEPLSPPADPQNRAHDALAPLPPAAPPAPQLSWVQRLRAGLSQTHHGFVAQLGALFSRTDLSEEALFENMFEVLVRADVGVATSQWLVAEVRAKKSASWRQAPEDSMRQALKETLLALLRTRGQAPECVDVTRPEFFNQTTRVTLMVGVNGVGKTTTTGKLAHLAASSGFKTVVGAADTFRAAAVEQLKVWGERAAVPVITRPPGSDPASVAYEAVQQARSQGARWCLIDTAGRLHNRNDLMQELSKIRRVVAKHAESLGQTEDVWLVLDATTGQNALQQARVFCEAVKVTGLVLTKLDGTAKGGVALAIVRELGIPICYIGVGEGVEDLQPFVAQEFVDALF